jgi:rubrerythrin
VKSNKTTVLETIRTAMEAENDAHNFYSRAAQKTENPRGRDMFSQLADFEKNHFLHLKDLYDSIKAEGKWISYPGTTFSAKGKKIRTGLTPSGRVGTQADDLDALSMAIKEERKAQEYYRNMTDETSDHLGKDMFKKLAREEELHERILNDQYYSLNNKGVWTWGE